MNARQRALHAYLETIRPHLQGSRSPEEMLRRILRCVGEDVGFAAEGFVAVAAQHGRRVLQKSVDELADVAAGALTSTIKDALGRLVGRKR